MEFTEEQIAEGVRVFSEYRTGKPEPETSLVEAYKVMRALEPGVTPYGVKAEPTTTAAVEAIISHGAVISSLSGAVVSGAYVEFPDGCTKHFGSGAKADYDKWEQEVISEWRARRKATAPSQPNSEANSNPGLYGTNAQAPAPQGASHHHRRSSDTIYGPPTRLEMYVHRRASDGQT